jgi:hypothetical protein
MAGLILLLLATQAGTLDAAGAADALAVDVINASEPTLCAEKDNVYLKLQSREARRFTVEAAHPAYIGSIVVDRWAPDFTSCDMSNDPAFKFERRRLTIYETEEWQLVGLTFPSFWRPNQVLVLYPADGYWRARPLPPQNLRWSAYGSSFLIGPIEVEGRPFVDIREISFDPATRTFSLNFVRGGSAALRLDKLDQERIVLDVALTTPVVGDRPFAALRSMFVTENNSDVAQVGWRAKGAQAWTQTPVMSFARTSAAELWAGRTVPSKHNTSAPDMVFKNFSSAAR